MTSTEQMTAEHQNRVAAWEANDRQHPDHFAFKMAFRDAVLKSMDDVCHEYEKPMVKDADLPALFRALDPLAEKLWLRSVGL